MVQPISTIQPGIGTKKNSKPVIAECVSVKWLLELLLPTDDIDAYLQQDAQIITLHPLPIGQHSLHGVFGQSDNIANVLPNAATRGPSDVVRSRECIEIHVLQTMGHLRLMSTNDFTSNHPGAGDFPDTQFHVSDP